MAQPYKTAGHNSTTSFNRHIHSILQGMAAPVNSGGIGATVGLKLHPWETQTFPGVRVTFIREAQPNTRLHRYESDVQIDVFTNNRNPALCRQISFELLSRLGFDIESNIVQTAVPQRNWASGLANPVYLQEMDLEITRLFDVFGDEDPDVSRRSGEFKLIFY
jgi:hypothetical protein